MIRAATVDDAPAVAAIQARGWRHAYADIVDAERMPDPEELTPRLAALIAEGRAVYVAEVQGRVAGFVVLEGNEVRAIYVDPPAQGAGVGTELMQAAEDELRRAGHTESFLWTFEANGLARAFYEGRGWERVAGHQERLAPEVRYRRSL